MTAASPTSTASTSLGSSPPRRNGVSADLREQLTGYLFIFPAVFLVGVFGIFPIAYAFYMSLRRWRVRDRGFIGLDNYEKAIGSWSGTGIFVLGFILLVGAYILSLIHI